MARARRSAPPPSPSGFLGIDAGGTRTRVRWESEDSTETREATFGPANLQLTSEPALLRHFRAIARAFPAPRALAVGMAGARTDADRKRILDAASRVWPSTPALARHDLAIALAAVQPPPATTRSRPAPVASILVLSGTGSCCYGESADGTTARVGGWGHLLGDEGSGYDIARSALRAVVARFDRTLEWGPLGARLLARLHRNEPDTLIPWMQTASKSDVAALAPCVFDAARVAPVDPLARDVIDFAARALAESALACASRLAGPSRPVRFVLAGSVLLEGAGFARLVGRYLRRGRPTATQLRLAHPAAAGAVRLARSMVPAFSSHPPPARPASLDPALPDSRTATASRGFIPDSTELSPTECRNSRSRHLDRLAPDDAIELMLSEDERLPAALRAEKPALRKALLLVERGLRGGGRLFYVGAGTSGRLGVLDASECPPTFRTPPQLVQGIIAGGEPAMFRAVEGAEDDYPAGARAVAFRGVGSRDVVVGIAASGRTPFVWGALGAARERGARTVILSFNPYLRFPRGRRPDVVIAPAIGPEILTGSTRLKAGTATKMVLNLLTTLAMVRLGKVVENLMVDVHPANRKLRERAVRIVRELVPVDEPSARAALEASGWVVKDALRATGYRG